MSVVLPRLKTILNNAKPIPASGLPSQARKEMELAESVKEPVVQIMPFLKERARLARKDGESLAKRIDVISTGLEPNTLTWKMKFNNG